MVLLTPHASARQVEQLMRELQARQKLINPAVKIHWPRCMCDDADAPPYPPDGFYASQMKDPRRAAELVEEVRMAFLTGGYASEFVREDLGSGLDGKDPVNQFSYSEGSSSTSLWGSSGPPPQATVTNYQQVLSTMMTAVKKLHYRLMAVNAEISGCVIGLQAADCNTQTTCDPWVACGKQIIESKTASFDSPPVYLPSTSGNDKHIGIEEGVYFVDSCDHPDKPLPGPGFGFIANRGRFTAPTGGLHGSGVLYCVISKISELGDGGNPPPATSDGKYHHVASASEGSDLDFTLADSPHPTVTVTCGDEAQGSAVTIPNGSGLCQWECFKGWHVTEHVLIFNHDFDTSPSTASPCGSGCTSCGGNAGAGQPGEVSVDLHSVHVSINLGPSEDGRRYGAIEIDTSSLLRPNSGESALPVGMFVRHTDEVSVAYPDGVEGVGPREVVTPNARLTIQANPSGTAPFSSRINVDVRNLTTLDLEPFKSIDLTYTPGTLHITESYSNGGATQETLFTHAEVAPGCDYFKLYRGLGSANGSVEELLSTRRNESPRVERYSLTQPGGGIPLRSSKTTYQTFSWGESVTAIAEGGFNNDTDAKRTRTWSYVGSGPAAGQVAFETDSLGPWTAFEYYGTNDNPNHLAAGMLKRVVHQYLDQTSTSPELNREEEYRYHFDIQLFGNGGNARPNDVIVERIDRVLGHETGRTYFIYWMASSDSIISDGGSTGGGPGGALLTPDAGLRETTTIVSATLGDQGNGLKGFLEQIILSPLAGPHAVSHIAETRPLDVSDPHDVRLVWALTSDGHLREHSLTANSETTVEGLIDPACTSPILGTRASIGSTSTAVTRSPTGTVIESSTEVDGLLIAHTFAAQTDERGRPTQTAYMDGTTSHSVYSPCCGALTSETDRDGNITNYEYDDMKRLTKVTKNPQTEAELRMEYTYDAAGQVTSVKRVGRDGGFTNIAGYGYDLLGNRTNTNDPLNHSSSEVMGTSADGTHRTRVSTSVDPDGSGPLLAPSQIIELYGDGQTYRISGEGTAPVQFEYGVVQETDTHYPLWSGQYVETVKEIRVGAGSSMTQWTKTYRDPLGRIYKREYADGAVERTYFNALGEVAKVESADMGTSGATGQIVLYAAGFGQAVRYGADLTAALGAGGWDGAWRITAIDLNQNGQIDFATDRITREATRYATIDGKVNRINTQTVWTQSGSAVAVQEVSRQEARVDGVSASVYSAGVFAGKTVQVRSPRASVQINADGTQTVQTIEHGRPTGVTTLGSDNSIMSDVRFAYDQFGRNITIADTRATTTAADDRVTTFTYDAADRVTGSTIAGPGVSQTTSMVLDNLGRVIQVNKPDGTHTFSNYTSAGLVSMQWGGGTHPTGYAYDPQGRMTSMTTWKQFNSQTGQAIGGAATTFWAYDSARGWLTSKTYDSGQPGPSYQYYPSGKLKRRIWARGVGTLYTYTAGGELLKVDYSDNTPDVTYAYDRMGRPATITDAVGIRTFAYNVAGEMTDEDFTAGVLDPVHITNSYDAIWRKTQTAMTVNGQARNTVGYGFDQNTGQLSAVSMNSTRRARYGYLTGSPQQVNQLSYDQYANNAWTQTLTGGKTFDGLDRLAAVQWSGSPSGTVLAQYAYTYNDANQRTSMTQTDGSTWAYTYDDLGQVTSGKHYANSVMLPGQQFEYTFDSIGNRTQAKMGGKSSGANLRVANYSSNSLNEYTSRGSPGGIDIMGRTNPQYVVSLTTGGVPYSPEYRNADYFQRLFSWTNTQSARFEEVLLEQDPTHTGYEKDLWVFLPKDPEQYSYDADGNMTQDGRWNMTWDGENRLIAMETRADLPTAMPRQRVEFGYDFMSRRTVKRYLTPVQVVAVPIGGGSDDGSDAMIAQVIDSSSSSVTAAGTVDATLITPQPWVDSVPSGWALIGKSKFVWDGWNLIAELDTVDASVRTFAWGLDLSGSQQGAGGIGGLVMGWTRSTGSQTGTSGTYLRYLYDGNGNVMAAADDAGVLRAKYEYGPFGETLTAEGDLAGDNPMRWSTKYTDGESGLVYYGYRYYNAGMGRWMSRDPIGEQGGENLFAFAGNSGINSIDPFGLIDEIGHHGYPLYLGGDPEQAVIGLCGGDHMKKVHGELNDLIEKESKKLKIPRQPEESIRDWQRRVWFKAGPDGQKRMIDRSLRASSLSDADRKAYVSYLFSKSLKHSPGTNNSLQRKPCPKWQSSSVGTTPRAGSSRSFSTHLSGAGCIVSAFGFLAAVGEAKAVLDDPSSGCDRVKDAMKEFLATGDCDALQRAKPFVESCMMKLGEGIGGGPGATFALSNAAAWDRLTDDCYRAKMAPPCEEKPCSRP
jgi:RHS repeat-associated protein